MNKDVTSNSPSVIEQEVEHVLRLTDISFHKQKIPPVVITFAQVSHSNSKRLKFCGLLNPATSVFSHTRTQHHRDAPKTGVAGMVADGFCKRSSAGRFVSTKCTHFVGKYYDGFGQRETSATSSKWDETEKRSKIAVRFVFGRTFGFNEHGVDVISSRTIFCRGILSS